MLRALAGWIVTLFCLFAILSILALIIAVWG